MTNARRDENHITSILWISKDDSTIIVPIKVNPVTWRMLIELSWTSAWTFINLTDTPASYAWQALKTARVNAAEDGLEYSSAGSWDVSWPASAVDERIVVFDLTTGKIIKDWGSTIADTLARANHTGTQGSDTIVWENVIWSPVGLTNLTQLIAHMWSSTITEWWAYTDNWDGSIGVATWEFIVRSTNADDWVFFTWVFAGDTNISLTDNAINIIYVDYNWGTPVILVTLDPTVVNATTRVPMFLITREWTSLSYVDVREDWVNFQAKTRERWFYTQRFSRVWDWSVVSESGTRNLFCTAWGFYFWNWENTVPAIDTSITWTFEYYSLISWVWSSTSSTQFDNLQYNDISTPWSEALATLWNNRYWVHWVYTIINTPSSYAVVYSQDEYNTLSDAEAATIPWSAPTHIEWLGQLLGRFIIKKSDTNGIMESSFSTSFNATTPTTHNWLSWLQGWTTDEYYHITSAQNTIIGNTSGTNTWDETTTTIWTLINWADAKTTPVDTDLVPIRDITGWLLEKVTWANI